jgi:hypothetical protein
VSERDDLRQRPWMSKGCDHCRSWWSDHRSQIPPQRFPVANQTLYKCRFCDAWWTDNQGYHPHELLEEEALRLIEEARG